MATLTNLSNAIFVACKTWEIYQQHGSHVSKLIPWISPLSTLQKEYEAIISSQLPSRPIWAKSDVAISMSHPGHVPNLFPYVNKACEVIIKFDDKRSITLNTLNSHLQLSIDDMTTHRQRIREALASRWGHRVLSSLMNVLEYVKDLCFGPSYQFDQFERLVLLMLLAFLVPALIKWAPSCLTNLLGGSSYTSSGGDPEGTAP